MSSAADALRRAYPGRWDAASAQEWVLGRRRLLVARSDGNSDVTSSVSSGCAASGASAHARELAVSAAHALARLDAGLGPLCEACGQVLPVERVESAPAATRCVGCSPASAVDTRWCR